MIWYFTIRKATSNNEAINNGLGKSRKGQIKDAGGNIIKRKSELRIEFHKVKPEGVSYEARMIARALKEEYQINQLD
jgi:hypothetical protein